ncbi:MAG: GNAT family N-acetyltransferase [Rubrimonas sp.]
MLQTARLTVRRYRAEDRPFYMALRADADVLRFMHWHEPPDAFDANRLEADLRRLPDQRGWVNLAVTDRAGGAMLGDLGVRQEGATAWIGLSLLPAARGRGLGRELAVGAVEWVRGAGARRFVVEVDEDNAPSLALFASLGFSAVGRDADDFGPYLILARDAR